MVQRIENMIIVVDDPSQNVSLIYKVSRMCLINLFSLTSIGSINEGKCFGQAYTLKFSRSFK